MTPKGARGSGADVEVVGGLHPSDPNAYPGTTWPAGSDLADFKPNARQFTRDLNSGKLPAGTIPIYYDAPWFMITQVGP